MSLELILVMSSVKHHLHLAHSDVTLSLQIYLHPVVLNMLAPVVTNILHALIVHHRHPHDVIESYI